MAAVWLGAVVVGGPLPSGARGAEPDGRARAIGEMAGAAQAFLAALDPGQRAEATFAWDDGERENWHFVPIEREGLPIRAMRPDQQALAFALLGSGMSQRGFVQASTIMSLEQILREIENAPRGDLNRREMAAIAPLVTAVLCLGLLPQLFVGYSETAIARIVDVRGRPQALSPPPHGDASEPK